MSTLGIPVSGAQHSIAHAGYRATIASVGATLRVLTHNERDLVLPFEADELRPGFRGATLAPWPNRVAGGRYEFAGEVQQLPLTEPERSNALHGLVCWLDFAAVSRTASEVVLEATIEPQAGYPFRVLISVRNTLSDEGLETAVTATNLGAKAAPFGTGPHPYLVAGDGRVDDWNLALPAREVLLVTEEQLLPLGVEDVATANDGAFDFRVPRPINELFIDHAFTGLDRDAAGRATVRLVAGNGRGVAMSWDSSCPWVQLYTADRPEPEASRCGLAVEPMTCPPNAFNSGTDVIVLPPGASTTASWLISAIG